MMHIEQIFSKPLARNINGVVKADQLDEHSVWVELDEYVVTNELDRHFRRFFENYLPAVQNPHDPDIAGNIGVWISGFFGSGKSHFIKILSYLLENRLAAYQGQSKRAAAFFKEKINDPLLYGDIYASVNRDTDVILFNIDSRANADDKEDAILKVFLKVFNHHLGYSEDYPHLAHMERTLDNDGLYRQFKGAYFNLGQQDWVDERHKFRFKRDKIIQALARVTGQSDVSAREWLNSLESDLPLTIANFSLWVKQYIDKHPGKNVIFLVDEVGQFIGTNTQMMLKLQTITENLGTTCGGRAWVIVTSQEDIDAVLGDLEAKEGKDFSKIQGRFKTRISLSSSNTSEVIQQRLLAKTAEAKDELAVIYNKQGDILKNQLTFDNSTTATLSSYGDNDEFVNNYPFVTYQYALVQKVFEAIRHAGATGKHLSRGERSLLDAFQNAAQQIKDEGVGRLIPFYRFYPAIESFLDTLVKMTIDNACAKQTLSPFDGNVLKTLFLLRYVDVVKSTLDNLVTLSIDQIDSDKIELKRAIEASLQQLEREMLVARNGDEYAFLTNEEKEIENEIRHTDVEASEITRELAGILFKEVLKGQSRYRYPGNNQDFDISRFCDDAPQDGKSDNDLVLKIVSPLQLGYDDYRQDSYCASYSDKDKGCVLVRLAEQRELWDELTVLLKTERFLRYNNRSNRPEQARLLSEKELENNARKKRLTLKFKELAQQADIFVLGNKRNDSSGAKPGGDSFSRLIDGAYQYLIENSFKHLNLLKACDDPLRELTAVLSADDLAALGLDISDPAQNAAALAEVDRYMMANDELNRAVYLKGLLGHFGRRPYGWRREEVMLLVAKLALAGKVSFTLAGAELALRRSLDAFGAVRSHGELRIRRTRIHSGLQLDKAQKIGKTLFQKPFSADENTLAAEFGACFAQWQTELQDFARQAGQLSHCPGKAVIEEGLRLVAGMITPLQSGQRSSYAIIERVLQDAGALDKFAEDFEDLSDFFASQFTLWQQLAAALNGKFNTNRHVLDQQPDAAKALNQLEAIYHHHSPYRQLKNVAGLISQVDKVNQGLLADKRQHALAKIDGRIGNIQTECDAMNAPAELRNQALYALQQERKRVNEAQSIAGIIAGQAGSVTLETQAIDCINQYNAALRRKEEERLRQQTQAAKAQQAAAATATAGENEGANKGKGKGQADDATAVGAKGDTEPAPAAVKPPPKPIYTVDPTLIAASAGYLETAQDIEHYLASLRAELQAALDSGHRVRLEAVN